MDNGFTPLMSRLKPPLANTSEPRDLEPDGADLEKLKRWQEQRMENRLRAEYESAIINLGDLVENNLSTPINLRSIRIDGPSPFRSSFLDWLVRPYLHQSDQNLRSVLNATRQIAHVLLESDIFLSVSPQLVSSRDVHATDNDVDVVLHTRPKGRYFLKTSTEFGNQEGNVTIQARARNAFGGAEVVDAAFSSGLKTRLAGHISLSAPLSPSLKTCGEVSLFGIEKDLSDFASCIEGIRGLRASIRSTTHATLNEFTYEAALRHIRGLTPSASPSIREAAGYSVKSSLSHTWLYDTRDSKALPSRGIYFRSVQEIAGLGGNVAFLKSQLSLQLCRHLFTNSTVSLSLKTGAMYPFGGRSIPFNDRFQLGGPLDVRLFRQNGLGPRDGSDSLGGDVFWAAGLSVLTNLPWRRNWPAKIHTFVNGGRLDVHNSGTSLRDTVVNSISKPSISAGIGILYCLDPARVEINFGVPLVTNKSDKHRQGFQLGIGLEFL